MLLTKIEILTRISLGEDSITEFKEKFSNLESITQELVALLNFQGGIICFGVNDDSDIIGLDKQQLKDCKKQLDIILNERIRPPCNMEVIGYQINDKQILVVEVPKDSPNQPYADNDGKHFTRVGTTKRKLSGTEQQRIAINKKNCSTDEKPMAEINPQNIFELINEIALKQYLQKRYKHLLQDTPAAIIETLHKIGLAANGQLNLAGLMLFTNASRGDLTIKMVSFKTNQQADGLFYDQSLAEGSLLQQLGAALNFCSRNLKQVQTEGFNSPTDEIDKDALTEIIINAMVHREYEINSAIRLFIFPNRLELISPGVLPNHLTEETAANGNSVARNPTITSHAYHILPYSGTGTGLMILKNKCKDAQIINVLADQVVKIIIPRV